MKLLLAFVLGMVAAVCIQGKAESWVVVSGIAQHFNGSYCNNHVTPGLGLEINGLAVGWYDNSNCKASFYAAKYWLPLEYGYFKAGVLGGGVTGYNSTALPVAGFTITYERRTWGANLIGVPPVGDSSGVLWLQWKKRF